EAPDAEIPIRTLRNISFNPNFGGGTMVVSLGCEKLQPERLIPAGSMQARGAAGLRDYDLVTLQDPSHVGFDAMIGSIIGTAEQHLQVLDRRRLVTCARRFKQEPGTALGLVDPNLKQACGSNAAVIVAQILRLAHARDQLLIVLTQFGEHVHWRHKIRIVAARRFSVRLISS